MSAFKFPVQDCLILHVGYCQSDCGFHCSYFIKNVPFVRILCLYIYIDVLFTYTVDLINALLNALKIEASKSALNRQ